MFEPQSFPTTFVWDKFPKAPVHEYARVSNPNRCELEKKLAQLEGGIQAFATASGQSAILLALSLLKAGDHVLCSADVYDGTIRTLNVMKKFWLDFTLLAPDEFADLDKHVQTNTKLLILETPSSTFLNTFDLKKVKKTIGNALLLVDNTVATPVFQKPLLDGADFVVHSLGKFIGGQDDLTGGVLITKEDRFIEELKHLQHTLGAVMAPFDCNLVMNRMKTLDKRMKKHTTNAAQIANYFEECEKIEQVRFPGFGGLLSFTFEEHDQANEFLSKVKIPIAQSYGGKFTRIQHPSTMINSSLSQEMKTRIELDERLVRLGVGLESADEIIYKLKKAL